MATSEGSAQPNESDHLRSPFGRQVRDALAHLYDPVYLQTHPLARILRNKGYLKGNSLGQALSHEIVAALAATSPAARGADSAGGRGHELLTLRYGEGLAVAEVQRRLAIGRSQFYREHRRALEAFVSLLQERWQLSVSAEDRPTTVLPSVVPLRPNPPNNLQAELTSFVGRERELSEVKRLLATSRLLTLTGTGGCGKTRLALRLAQGALEQFADGVWVVQLATLADPKLVPQTVAFALGLSEFRDRPITVTLTDFLRAKQILLLLDNCEHLLLACANLVEILLRECPRLQIVVTSREALGIGGETRWRVPSLVVPGRDSPMDDPVQVGRYESVALFMERARSMQHDFCLDVDNAPAVAEICRRLDGIPLAVELAAARVGVLAVEQIARRLDNLFGLLASGSRTALPRHQTLRATIDWSHDLIDRPAQVLLRRLSVFAGGWTLEGAEAVCGDWPAIPELGTVTLRRESVLDFLAQLVDRSLVRTEKSNGETRYNLLETIRQYAAEKLAQSGEEVEAHRRHRNWYVTFSERELPRTLGREQERCLPRLAAEHANFRAALRWSNRDPDGAEAELRLAAALARYWRWIGRWVEATTWLDDALARSSYAISATRARALTTRGNLEWAYRGNLDLALKLAREGVSMARVVDEPRLLDIALRQEALIRASQFDIQGASQCFDEALVVARRARDQREVSAILGQRAIMCHGPNELGVVMRDLDEALTIARAVGDVVLLAELLTFQGGALIRARDYARAETVLTEAFACGRAVGYRDTIGWSMAMLGDIAVLGGNRPQALARYAEAFARELERGTEGLPDEALVLERVAALGAEIGERESAVRLFAWCDAQQARRGTVWTRFVFNRFGVSEIAAVLERALAVAREALGQAEFARAWEAGRAMMPDEAGVLGRSVLKALQTGSR